MSKAFIIEVRSRAAGIVVHDGRRYRFYAAAHEFNGLEGRDFRSPNDAQKAAAGHIATPGRSVEADRPGRGGGRGRGPLVLNGPHR
jgi:hypothetical protein